MTDIVEQLAAEDRTEMALAAAAAIRDEDLESQYYSNEDEDDLDFVFEVPEVTADGGAGADANETDDGDTEAVDSDLWITSHAGMLKRLTPGAAITLKEAFRRSPSGEWEPTAPVALGVTRAVVRQRGGCELSDGVTLPLGRSQWSYEDGYAVFTSGLAREVFSIQAAPPSTDAEDLRIEAVLGRDDGPSEAVRKAVDAARAEMRDAVQIPEEIGAIKPGSELYEFHRATQARIAAARGLIAAETLGGGVTDEQWREGRDVKDPDGLAREVLSNRAWVVRLRGAHELLESHLASGRLARSADTETALEEFAAARRAVKGESRVLAERSNRVREAGA